MAVQNDILQEIAKISDVIGAARNLVEDNQVINLEPLQGAIQSLCDQLAGVDGDTARKVKPILLGLVEELSHLDRTMAERHEELSTALRALSSHGSAASAYSTQSPQPKKSS
ncbi:MAG: hypothetical protein R3229_16975 [Alphaproteobacteria bacterium]|nr:hypothetical protein [Alphaproteobacteria bacterium]